MRFRNEVIGCLDSQLIGVDCRYCSVEMSAVRGVFKLSKHGHFMAIIYCVLYSF